jgi:hypothetical protein
MNEVTQKLLEGMRNEVRKTMRKIDSCRDMTGDGLKGIVRNGMENLVKAVEGVLLGMSEELDKERIEREEKEEKQCKRIEEIEKKGEEIEENIQRLERKLDSVEVSQQADREVMEKVGEAMVRGRKFCRLRDSVRITEGQVEEATCKLKVLGIQLERESEDRREIVRMAVEKMRKDVSKESKEKFENILRRTRVVVLGKGTNKVKEEDKWSVPILLCCRCPAEKEEVEQMLKLAGYKTLFYWPDNMVDFVRGAREELRRKGFEERRYDVRIRPERKGGRLIIRADIRTKDRGKFRPEVSWIIPGERKLMEELGIDVYTPLESRN